MFLNLNLMLGRLQFTLKEGSGDCAGVVLHRSQSDALGVTALSKDEFAAYSCAL